MDLGLSGKVAVIIGASADVGRATALTLAKEGACLLLVARREQQLQQVAEDARRLGAEAATLVEDVREPQSGERIVARASDAFGRLDILVNTVGPFPRTVPDPLFGDDESWRAVFESVFLPAVHVCRSALPVMKAAGRGVIVNTAANSARHFSASTAQYGAMKAALTHVTKNWARDAAPHGVRVNAILPGWIKTEALAQMVQTRASSSGESVEDVERALMQQHGSTFWSGRMGEPQDYADLIAFLVSERARYVNGALIPIDGGSAA